MSIRELADHLECTHAALSQLELGRRRWTPERIGQYLQLFNRGEPLPDY